MFSVPIYYKQLFELTISNHWKSIFSSFSKQKMINNNNELTTTATTKLKSFKHNNTQYIPKQ